ncbi:MAG: alpha-glucan family phosphorylase [Bacteroidales bacterium]|nr:alpha-glucan family phosphorylase [Bacteroidales bacterium]
MEIKMNQANQPEWRFVNVKSQIPAEFKKLETLSRNLWWTWNFEAMQLFRSLDKDLFHEVQHNAVELLRRLSYDRMLELAKDQELLARIDKVYADFEAYMNEAPDTSRASVAYFCMEYGLSHILRIYSGGLGVLAGDYLKEASDSNVDMCAVGFLYRYGYFSQELSMDGQQIPIYEPSDFDGQPIERVLDEHGNQLVVEVPFPGYTVYTNIWQVNVGRIKLFLLDTDLDRNSEYDRSITHTLYGGDWENRLKQEYLLGIGGVLALKRMGITKDIYHCNEGHAALCNVQRLVDYVATGLSFAEALELVRASSLYTVHTPVPAGHDYFEEGLFGKYMGSYPAQLGISWKEFIGLGRVNPEDASEKFSMSTFLCNTCQEINGVSWLHGEVSHKMFAPTWPGYFPEENHVGYVTNGVHFPTWSAQEWKELYAKYFDKAYYRDQSNQTLWEKIYDVPNDEIWATRKTLKLKLTEYIQKRFSDTWLKNQGDPSRVVSLLQAINPNGLILGFARRFATYKRAHLLFTDVDRLAKIVNNPERPVQFLFAGKAHPTDGAGQGLIKRIYEISQRPEFLGKIIFLENYDMELARRLVSGVDIWMNTPTRPLEASGTSGEKALMNGVLNFSVLDGWWLEGYRKGAGWALTEKRTYENQAYQDALDASTIYSILENEIIPLYYDRKEGKDYSEGWVQTIKNSIAQIAPHYTMKRQLDDYYAKFYNQQAARFRAISANDNQLAKEIVQWKRAVSERWDSISIIACDKCDTFADGHILSGKDFEVKVVIDEQGLNDAVGVELVVVGTNDKGEECVVETVPFTLTERDGNLHTFVLKHNMDATGTFKCAFRMYPKHAALPHRQDFNLVRWFN